MTNNEFKMPEMTENFADLLNEQFGENGILGTVVKGTIVKVSDDYVTVDVGLKSEGNIPVREFGTNPELKVGDEVEVLVDRYEDKDGNIVLSREKARREEVWVDLEKSMNAGERVNGIIFGRVKGGFTVDLNGAIAFLPGSQIDIRPIRDITPLMGISQPFQILKMDKVRGNIVVSRRVVLEETRAEARAELIDGIKEGAILDGVVKNITDYGAFIDLGGVDGLLHVTDISWKRINHPAEVLSVGQTVKVQVIRFNEDTQRISLGMKQLENDPWQAVADKYKVGEVYKGKVTNITDYGAFVELEDGIEGLVHVSEMSWTRKNVHPGKIVSTSEEVDVKVLEVDGDKRRISLGIKQCQPNPWAAYVEEHPVGSVISGKIKNITEFGLFVGLTDEIDGMIHLSDISWEKSGEEAVKDYTKGQEIEAKIIDVDVEKERISLGIKQLSEDSVAQALASLKKGDVVKAVVKETDDKGITVEVDGLTATIKKADLSRDKAEQNPENFHEGDMVEAKVTSVDKKNAKIGLSIKALEVDEEKKVLEEYSNSTGGSSLGEALGEALKKAN
ncbi:MAG: 30S ribosomal protein S1 [Alphaproteobacteria bacterium]|nr:30S ribosomal protein S1 [Alphaproteobacteria bacterium]